MATMAVEPVFVDTNSLIYTHQAFSPFHAPATAKLHASPPPGILCGLAGKSFANIWR